MLSCFLSSDEQCRDGIRWLVPYGPERRLFRALNIVACVIALLCIAAAAATLFHDELINTAGFRIGGWHSSRLRLLLGFLFSGSVSVVIWLHFFQTASRQEQVEHHFQRVRGTSVSSSLERIRGVNISGYAVRIECDIETEQGIKRVRPFVTAVSFPDEKAAESYLRRLDLNRLTVAINPQDALEVFVLPWDDRQVSLQLLHAVLSIVIALAMLAVSLA